MLRVRLKEVAADAGVSISTAAAVLRGEGGIKEATKIRVQEVAKRLGYQRNSAASILSSQEYRHTQKAALVILITAFPRVPEDPTKYPWAVSKEFSQQTASELGLFFEHRNITHVSGVSRIIREIYARGCEGIVLGRCVLQDELPIPWEQFSVVTTEHTLQQKGFDVIRSNHFRSTLNLLQKIRSMGYERIGICLREHKPILPDDEARYGAALAFQNLHCPPEQRLPIARIPYGAEDASRDMLEWYHAVKPDVVVSHNQHEAEMLSQKGIRIPEDVSFVAMHVSQQERGQLAGLQFNVELISVMAIHALMDKIKHGIRGLSSNPREFVVSPCFILGTTCPDKSALS